jgi:RNA polymerase sigma factor (sigma-70 family)
VKVPVAPVPARPGDADLATRASRGDEDACRALIECHRDAVYRLIRSQTADADAALDLTQESFVAAFTNLHRYDLDRPFRGWIMRIALNKCRDWRRRQMVRRFFWQAQPLDGSLDVADERPGPDAEASSRQELARTREAIQRLPDKLREVLLLRTVEEMSQAAVAQFLGVSQKTVETRLYRARLKLTELLAKPTSAL